MSEYKNMKASEVWNQLTDSSDPEEWCKIVATDGLIGDLREVLDQNIEEIIAQTPYIFSDIKFLLPEDKKAIREKLTKYLWPKLQKVYNQTH